MLYDGSRLRWKFVGVRLPAYSGSARKALLSNLGIRHAASGAQPGRHVEAFVGEHSAATEGFVVCRCPRPMRLAPHVTAIPWCAL